MSSPLGPSSPFLLQKVLLVSGKPTDVQTNLEAEWFNQTRDAYTSQLKFTQQTDMADLDRLLIMELLVFRWTQQLSRGEDYENDPIDTKQMASDLKLYSDQINKLKESMGITKKQRDSAANDGNFAAWFADVKRRARIFNVHRQEQVNMMIALGKQLFFIVDTFNRSDAEERQKMGFATEHDIFVWVNETMRREFDAHDKFFRENEQKMWVADQ